MNGTVAVFWCVAMGWLVMTKIVPLLDRGQPPNQGIAIPDTIGQEHHVRWRIWWKDRRIGTADNRAMRRVDGTSLAVSTVDFDELPLVEIARDFFGPAAALLQLGQPGRDMTTQFEVTSRLRFDAFGHLEQVDSRARVAEFGELFHLRGLVVDGGLELTVQALLPGSGDGEPQEVFRRRVELPPDALVVDALSPSPRLTNLRVGQEWSFRAFRPFPPQNPWQLVQARVERTEAYIDDGEYEGVFVVTFTDNSSSLTTSSTPFSTLWVREDGTVVRQQIMMGKVAVDFERVPDDPTQ